MILDPAAIARKYNVDKEAGQLDMRQDKGSIRKGHALESASLLVFKAGEGALKAVPLAMVSRLQVFENDDITASADKMVVQFNDQLMQLSFIEPESQKLAEDKVTTIVLSDDRSETALGLVIDDVIDIDDGILDIITSTTRPGILGSMILSGQTVDILDVSHFLSLCKGDWFSTRSHATSSYVPQQLENIRSKEEAVTNGHANGYMEAKIKWNSKTNGGRPSVLVVDDSAFFRNMLFPILTAAGYDVSLAEDALHAIALHDQGRNYDIIVSDIEMPGMDGCEFVEKMRQESTWKDKPFIAITSHNTPEDIEYGYKKGFNQYIGKFDKDELIETLQNVKVANG